MPALPLDTLTAAAIILPEIAVVPRLLTDGSVEAEREHREHGRGDMRDA